MKWIKQQVGAVEAVLVAGIALSTVGVACFSVPGALIYFGAILMFLAWVSR